MHCSIYDTDQLQQATLPNILVIFLCMYGCTNIIISCMKEGVYYGQMVVGPAGCGKVHYQLLIVNKLSCYAGHGADS
jgi:hypothetical protein